LLQRSDPRFGIVLRLHAQMVPHKRLTSRGLLSNCDDLLTTGTSRPAKWYSGSVVAPGFIAIGSGPGSDNGVRFIGSTTVTGIDDTHVHLDTGVTLDGDLAVAEHMHTSALNVYAAGDVALAYNLSAGRRIPAEHWRDVAQQGLVAGLSTAGHPAAWDKVPGFSCTIGESTLKYCGWGTGYEHSRLVEHHNGFTVWYESAGEVVGVLSLNADDDYRLADQLVRSHTPMTI
jgi:hypothetical protein